MDRKKKILIAIIVVVLVVIHFNVAVSAFIDMNSPHACGYVEYVPIEVLPEGASAVVLTEKDFSLHRGFRVIFDEESQDHRVTLVYDIHRPGNPKHSIGEIEGRWIYYDYPYVEYDGQLYECQMTIA